MKILLAQNQIISSEIIPLHKVAFVISIETSYSYLQCVIVAISSIEACGSFLRNNKYPCT